MSTSPTTTITQPEPIATPHTKLYAFGSNGAGQLGVGHLDDLSEPQVCLFSQSTQDPRPDSSGLSHEVVDYIPDGASITKLVAGGNHTLILTGRGVMYASGNDGDGRCGLEIRNESDSERRSAFQVVSWMKGRNVTDVAATWEASFFVEDRTKVWVCGRGEKGELGLTEDVTVSATPRLVFDTREDEAGGSVCHIVGISGGMSHVVILLSTGHAYGWGSCRKGQLGQDLSARKSIWKPCKIDLSFAPSNAIVGRDFSLFTDSSHSHILLGELRTAQQALEMEQTSSTAHYLAGWSTVYQLDQGHISSYGQGRRGQLAPTELPPVSVMAAGSEHCVAILNDGRLVAWGWGEHGNCGTPLDDRGNVIDRFNTLHSPSLNDIRLVGVGAGCASSFVWGLES